ncbi:MAG: hypothetical protein ACSHWQ_10285 [Spongiibacteraceae bacterium]
MTILKKACLIGLVMTVVSALSVAEENFGLLKSMGTMQMLTHKIQLSLEKNNLPAAKFYGGELGAFIKATAAIDSYSDYPVGRMTNSILRPAQRNLMQAIEAGASKRAIPLLKEMITACNDCHTLTEHAYIRIQTNSANPYLQSFDPE